jgi:4'-phosphopantetheinyl transferase
MASDAAPFLPAGGVPPLEEGEIHVWHDQAPAAGSAAVSAHARARLDALACAYAGSSTPPAIATGPHGKPHAPSLPWLEFNLSHAGTHLLLAFARHQPLGIDLECTQRRPPTEGIARRYFAASEAEALERLPPERRARLFLDLWTHKEAVLKAMGHGLSFGLERVVFALEGDRVAGLQAVGDDGGGVAGWHILRLAPAPTLLGTLAWRGAPRTVRCLAWVG